MIDLHLHTTASDGWLSPEQVVEMAARTGLHTIAVADHDTVAALDQVAQACAGSGIAWVSGIEITSIREGVDLHILGYFLDHRSEVLTAFLADQMVDRQRRLREMVDRLTALGLALSLEDVLGEHSLADARWVGRPLLARALVRGGFVRTVAEAFDRYLGEGRPAWVSRRAPAPEAVIGLIHDTGGLASVAHPGLVGRDEWIASLVPAGLDAVEVYYTEHTAEMTAHYHDLARRFGLAMTGGSDFHGDPAHGALGPGAATLPEEAFADLKGRL